MEPDVEVVTKWGDKGRMGEGERVSECLGREPVIVLPAVHQPAPLLGGNVSRAVVVGVSTVAHFPVKTRGSRWPWPPCFAIAQKRTAMRTTSITLILLMIGSTTLSAQKSDAPLSDLFAPKRIVKTNLAGYALLAVSANYEQQVGRHTSVGLLGGYKLPSVIKVSAIGDLDGENQTYAGEVEPRGLFVNPYFRYYPNKAFHGFYLEAFGRYFNYSFLVPYDYDKDGRTIAANLDGTASGMGGGLALGVQVPLGTRVFLDMNLGFGMGVGNIHLETNDPNLELEDYRSIQRNIEQYEDRANIEVFILRDILTDPIARSSDTKAWADFNNKLFPIMRGGISIGYAF